MSLKLARNALQGFQSVTLANVNFFVDDARQEVSGRRPPAVQALTSAQGWAARVRLADRAAVSAVRPVDQAAARTDRGAEPAVRPVDRMAARALRQVCKLCVPVL